MRSDQEELLQVPLHLLKSLVSIFLNRLTESSWGITIRLPGADEKKNSFGFFINRG